jgi:gluconate kinase
MPPALLDSQFAALEAPGPDERPLVMPIEPPPRELAEAIMARLGLAPAARA